MTKPVMPTRKSCQVFQFPGCPVRQRQMASLASAQASASIVEIGVGIKGSAIPNAVNPYTRDLSKTLVYTSRSPSETTGFWRDWKWSIDRWWILMRDDVDVQYVTAAFCSHYGLNPDQCQLCLADVALHADQTVRQVSRHAQSQLRRALRLSGSKLCRQLCLRLA